MINYIWYGLIVIGICIGITNGNVESITESIMVNAKTAVELSIGIIGIMSLWLGIMRLAEAAGLVEKLGKCLRPIMVWIFPDIPSEHPAMGAMIMNISANMLGLGDAATPFGLKAMKELQTLSSDKYSASDSMCTFLAINTSAITIIPATVIGYRAAAGSNNPTEIIGATLIASTVSTIVAIITSKILANNSKNKNKLLKTKKRRL